MLMSFTYEREVQSTHLKSHKSPIFDIQLQIPITSAIQLAKLEKFSPIGGFKAGLYFK